MGLKKLSGNIPNWEFNISPLEYQLDIIRALCQKQAKTFASIRDVHDVIIKNRVREIANTMPPGGSWPPGTNVKEEISKRYNAIEDRIKDQTTKLQNALLKETAKFERELNSQIEALKKLISLV